MTRWGIRKMAARAFAFRNRRTSEPLGVRRPERGETPLSEQEIFYGVAAGLIAMQQPTKEREQCQR